jgi:hypothetical protein
VNEIAVRNIRRADALAVPKAGAERKTKKAPLAPGWRRTNSA